MFVLSCELVLDNIQGLEEFVKLMFDLKDKRYHRAVDLVFMPFETPLQLGDNPTSPSFKRRGIAESDQWV